MSKLEELGGLEKFKDRLFRLDQSCTPDWTPHVNQSHLDDFYALIESVESLTSERDELKKRVEELERREANALLIPPESRIAKLEAKLQAARELAERVNAVEKIGLNDGLTIFGDAVVNDAVLEGCKAKARDFLKMLEESHAS